MTFHHKKIRERRHSHFHCIAHAIDHDTRYIYDLRSAKGRRASVGLQHPEIFHPFLPAQFHLSSGQKVHVYIDRRKTVRQIHCGAELESLFPWLVAAGIQQQFE